MGSGVLLAALVVLWFVVLVPMVVTRGDAHARTGAADSGRTLQRRRPVDPVVHAETERVTIDRAALMSSGELRVDVHAVRRRTLAGRPDTTSNAMTPPDRPVPGGRSDDVLLLLDPPTTF